MNVLHVNQDLSVEGGGVARVIRECAPHLQQAGANVYAATAEEQINALPPGIEAHRFMPSAQEQGRKNGLSAWQRVLSGYSIDVVHVHEINNVHLIHYLAGAVPTVLHLHNYRYWCPGTQLFYAATGEICPLSVGWKCIPNAYTKRCNNRHPKRLYRSISGTKARRALFDEAVQFVASSEYMRDRAARAGLPGEKINIVPCAVDASRFQQKARPPKRSPTPGYVLFVGRLTGNKGIEFLIDAFARLRSESNQLVIVGGGQSHYQRDIERLIEQRGLQHRVHLLGWQSGAELSWLYRHCALLVVPSIWEEVFGIVGLEAMAAAKPVVAFDMGGISQWLVHGKTGFLVPRKDVDELTAKIERLLAHPDRAEDMGQAGHRRFLAHFTAEQQARSLMNVYQRAIDQF